MAKNSLSKLIITLTVIGLVSAFALAFVFLWTTPKIEEHQAMAKEEAIRAVLPGAEEIQEVKKGDQIFYEGYKSGSRVGVAMVAEGGGFQGMIELMLGTDPASGKIYGIRVLTHSETPGLGANITGKKYKTNFVDKPFGDYNVVKRPAESPMEVEAISGATISSEKVTTIVEKAVEDIESVYGGGA